MVKKLNPHITAQNPPQKSYLFVSELPLRGSERSHSNPKPRETKHKKLRDIDSLTLVSGRLLSSAQATSNWCTCKLPKP
jgi:hypothetical protein